MSDKFNPDQHQRRSIRLRGWNYTSPGAYFITICTHQRENLFDDPTLRELAENAWRNIPHQVHAGHVSLDEWVVMPNHLHGILVLTDDACRGEASRTEVSLARDVSFRSASPLPHGVESGSIGAIIGNFKSLVTKRANQLRHTPGAKLWQRGYYERIIRNERELNAIRQYIRQNPQRWREDRDNVEAVVARMRLVP